MEKRCNKCGGQASNLCGGCKTVYYCGAQHQKEDWQYHKGFCLMTRAKAKPLIQEETPKDECVGTFRWTDNSGLPPLPPFPRTRPPLTDWNALLTVRIPSIPSVEPQFIDALSYPYSLVYCLSSTNLPLNSTLQHVLILGASERAEERLSVVTNYFQDIAEFFPSVSRWKLYFTGPEISTGRHATVATLAQRVEAEYYRGTTGELLSEHYGEFTPENCVVVGFNPGFGSGYLPLMSSWVSDLITLLNLRLPVFFTCANDYSVPSTQDLRGELLVLAEVLGPQFFLQPQQNPMSAISTLHPPGGRETVTGIQAWTRSSSFLYGIQGYRDGATAPLIPRQRKAEMATKLQELSIRLGAETGN